jgi:hypothetical protein
MAGVDLDLLGLGPLSPPLLAEMMYVGEHITISGGDLDGRYEIVERTPLTDGLRLVVQSIHPD